MRAPTWLLIAAYLGLAVLLTWPAAAQLGTAVPGSAHTDLWDSLWSVHFVASSLAHGRLPYHTVALNHPDGGALLVADPLGALLASPAVWALGLPVGYTLLVWGQLAFAGICAHRLAEEWLDSLGLSSGASAWVAGVGYAAAPVLLAGVHNGNSESYSGGWAALAAWAGLVAARRGGLRRCGLAALSLPLACLGSWYGGVVAFLFAGAVAVLPPRDAALGWRGRLAVLSLGVALTAPLALGTSRASTGPDNLIGIKDPRETALVRRSTGAADPVAFVRPGDYRSPDFREISRYGEDFIHTPYLGWVLLLAALGARRARGLGAVALAGAAGGVLALGPVLAQHGAAVIFLDDRAMPLPYLLLERVPGFSSLSLVWRLSQATALAMAVLAAVGLAGRPRWAPWVCLAVLLEVHALSPLQGLPDTADVRVASSLYALRDAPDGAVMNFPVVGGRGYLYEATVHGKPLAGSLNFPNNAAAQKVWKALLDGAGRTPEVMRREVAARARRLGVRYLLVHVDPTARPDMHDGAVRAWAGANAPLAWGASTLGGGEAQDVLVYQLW